MNRGMIKKEIRILECWTPAPIVLGSEVFVQYSHWAGQGSDAKRGILNIDHPPQDSIAGLSMLLKPTEGREDRWLIIASYEKAPVHARGAAPHPRGVRSL